MNSARSANRLLGEVHIICHHLFPFICLFSHDFYSWQIVYNQRFYVYNLSIFVCNKSSFVYNFTDTGHDGNRLAPGKPALC